jgi:hypothetical protein
MGIMNHLGSSREYEKTTYLEPTTFLTSRQNIYTNELIVLFKNYKFVLNWRETARLYHSSMGSLRHLLLKEVNNNFIEKRRAIHM